MLPRGQGLHWLFLGWERWRMSTFSNRLRVLWLDKYSFFTYMLMDWPASMNARNRITHSTRTDFLKSSCAQEGTFLTVRAPSLAHTTTADLLGKVNRERVHTLLSRTNKAVTGALLF